MDNAALVRCIDWVAHGFEIVHTHFADWKFKLADCFADDALHGRLFVGPRVPIERFADPAAELRALKVELLREGEVVDRGEGSVVLDGPVDALRQWVDAMHAQPQHWPIRAGDVVTTGTITDAWPMQPGMRFETRLSDSRLSRAQARMRAFVTADRPSGTVSGKVAEWSNAPDSKSGVRFYRTVGSNPTLSARDLANTGLRGPFLFYPRRYPRRREA